MITVKYLSLCGDMVRCYRCGQHYVSVCVERDGFDVARGFYPCPKCEAELQRPKRRGRRANVAQLAGCALFVACVVSWLLVTL